MRKMVAVLVVMVLALAFSQPAMAAPTQGFAMAAGHTNSDNLYARLLAIFGAVWGGGNGGHNGAVWGGGSGGHNGAVWGGSSGGANNGAIWGPGGGDRNGAIWGGQNSGSTDGAIWGCKTC